MSAGCSVISVKWKQSRAEQKIMSQARYRIGTALLAAALALPSTAVWADVWSLMSSGEAKEQLDPPACLKTPGADAKMLPSGCSDAQLDAWVADITLAREEHLIRIGFDGRLYDAPHFQWIQKDFVQPQAMLQDRYLYDPKTGRYTVDRYLDDVEKRYGGIDSVLLWQSYPTMGIDDRNQLDLLRSLPGGLAGVRDLVGQFHRRGVHVLFPMMLWDQGTNPAGGVSPANLAAVMKEIGADGINGDTQNGVPRTFVAAAEAVGHPLVFEPELVMADEALSYNLMGWGYYLFPAYPLVDRFKWLEPRHKVHISDRWKKDKKDVLQFAFFNGIGVEAWENVWGLWNGLTPWDAEALRRVATIERAQTDLLASPQWRPYAPTLRDRLFASRWQKRGRTFWSLINRNDYAIDGPVLVTTAEPGRRYVDLYHGVEVTPTRAAGRSLISLAIEANGFGALLEIEGEIDPPTRSLMVKMQAMTARPLSDFSKIWKPLTQTMLPNPETAARAAEPPEMVRIPEGEFLFKVKAVHIEALGADGSDVQYPWEQTPRSEHVHNLHVKAFWIDKYPVTNAQYKAFLNATGYSPADKINFLRDWKGGTYPAGWANKPVTWVSREDAQAYATWAGKRLPNEWEWQYAAQGADGWLYPWGNDWAADAVPASDTGRTMRGPDDVTAHPRGASPFGVMDMVGNVWQWTNEFADDHTRAATLRGGSYYKPQGSMWYFPQAYRLDQHQRLLLMSPGMDRSGGVGFRCVSE
jgi:formylglycine-generating enzyme required for sulfatase activity